MNVMGSPERPTHDRAAALPERRLPPSSRGDGRLRQRDRLFGGDVEQLLVQAHRYQDHDVTLGATRTPQLRVVGDVDRRTATAHHYCRLRQARAVVPMHFGAVATCAADLECERNCRWRTLVEVRLRIYLLGSGRGCLAVPEARSFFREVLIPFVSNPCAGDGRIPSTAGRPGDQSQPVDDAAPPRRSQDELVAAGSVALTTGAETIRAGRLLGRRRRRRRHRRGGEGASRNARAKTHGKEAPEACEDVRRDAGRADPPRVVVAGACCVQAAARSRSTREKPRC